MDRVGAEFERVVQEMRDKLKATPLLLHLPIGNEDKFTESSIDRSEGDDLG